MKKAITILAILLVVLAIAYVYPVGTDMSSSPKPLENGDYEVQGTILTIDTSKVPVDGPVLLTLSTEKKGEVVVVVPSMGINLCVARPHMENVFTMKKGDKVEARGSVTEVGIIPCEGTEHYLRVVKE